jgi:hypothetical protein
MLYVITLIHALLNGNDKIQSILFHLIISNNMYLEKAFCKDYDSGFKDAADVG